MPAKPLRPCTTPGCRGRAETGRCAACRGAQEANPRLRRGTAAERGYDATWTDMRIDYLTRHPRCALCGRLATVPDHYPDSRRRLVAAGVANPDADERLRPLCASCHNRQTAIRQPGGFHRT